MLFRNSLTEVFLTRDVELLGLILAEFKKANLYYEKKIVHSGTQNRMTGTFFGQLGERTESEMLYYLYVKKKDSQQARCLIQKVQSRG